MTTLVVKLTPAQAKAIARCADRLQLSHEELAREAVLMFVRCEKASAPKKAISR